MIIPLLRSKGCLHLASIRPHPYFLFPTPRAAASRRLTWSLHALIKPSCSRVSRPALLRVGCFCQEQDVDKQTGGPISKEVSISWQRAAFSRSPRLFPPSAEQKRQRGRTALWKRGGVVGGEEKTQLEGGPLPLTPRTFLRTSVLI